MTDDSFNKLEIANRILKEKLFRYQWLWQHAKSVGFL